MRRALVMLGIAAVAAVSIGGVAPARTTAAACATSGLVVWVNTNENAAAGSSYVTLEFTNQSGRTCTLSGYPGVSALDLSGRTLGSPAERVTSSTRSVSLADGATAHALLRITNAGNYPAAACRPRPAAGLRVYPPNQTASKTVPFPFAACSRAGRAFLQVKAVAG